MSLGIAFFLSVTALVFMFSANASKLFWESKPVYFVIDWGYQAVACLLLGAVMGLWRG